MKLICAVLLSAVSSIKVEESGVNNGVYELYYPQAKSQVKAQAKTDAKTQSKKTQVYYYPLQDSCCKHDLAVNNPSN